MGHRSKKAMGIFHRQVHNSAVGQWRRRLCRDLQEAGRCFAGEMRCQAPAPPPLEDLAFVLCHYQRPTGVLSKVFRWAAQWDQWSSSARQEGIVFPSDLTMHYQTQTGDGCPPSSATPGTLPHIVPGGIVPESVTSKHSHCHASGGKESPTLNNT